MTTPLRADRQSGRPALVAVIAVALLSFAAAAGFRARQVSGAGQAAAERYQASDAVTGAARTLWPLIVLAVLVGVASVIAIGWLVSRLRHRPGPERERHAPPVEARFRRLAALAALGIVLGAVIVVIGIRELFHGPTVPAGSPLAGSASGAPPEPDAAVGSPASPGWGLWGLVIAVAGLIVVGITAVVRRRAARRERGRGVTTAVLTGLARATAPAPDSPAAPLGAGPREAVLAAYRDFEGTVADLGGEVTPWSTASDIAHRAAELTAVRRPTESGEPRAVIEQLTELFWQARYSRDDVPAAHALAAASAVDVLRSWWAER